MPAIKFSEILQLTSDDAFAQWMREQLANYTADSPPALSDCLVNYHNGGAPFIEALAAIDEEYRMIGRPSYRWKIQVLCDKWGEPMKPGDIVKRKHKRPLRYKPGVPIPGSELSAMKMDGRYKEELEYYSEFHVDEKGCIDVGFHDAMHFLSLWGVHYRNGKPLTTKQRKSANKIKSPDGTVKNVHYYRYKEAPLAQYSDLPQLKKRGRPRNEENI